MIIWVESEDTSQGQWRNKVVPSVRNRHSIVSWLSLQQVSSLLLVKETAGYVMVRARWSRKLINHEELAWEVMSA